MNLAFYPLNFLLYITVDRSMNKRSFTSKQKWQSCRMINSPPISLSMFTLLLPVVCAFKNFPFTANAILRFDMQVGRHFFIIACRHVKSRNQKAGNKMNYRFSYG